ncbi:MAG: biotin transporter BioY [Clostridium sp.]
MKLNLSVKEITLVGMCAALMAIFSQLSIPLPFTTVPVTMQTFGLIIISIVLGRKLGTLSIIIWVLIGVIGIPVFAGFSGGIGVLLGPTGGYIIGFILMSFIIGLFSNTTKKWLLFLGVTLGQAVQFFFGVIQLKIVLGLTTQGALAAGLYPFILKDIIIITVSVFIGITVKKALKGVLINNDNAKSTSY